MYSSIILWLIVGCEVAFWVFLVSGLSARYVFELRRLGTILLYLVPWIDVVLLSAVVADLRSGSVATFAHGLAAAYIGFTVAFGKATLDWADRVFAHRFAGGEKPEKPPGYGKALLLYELKWFGRCLAAVFITIGLSFVAIVVVDEPSRTEAFELWMKLPLITAGLWLLFGPIWSALLYWSPQKQRPEHNKGGMGDPSD